MVDRPLPTASVSSSQWVLCWAIAITLHAFGVGAVRIAMALQASRFPAPPPSIEVVDVPPAYDLPDPDALAWATGLPPQPSLGGGNAPVAPGEAIDRAPTPADTSGDSPSPLDQLNAAARQGNLATYPRANPIPGIPSSPENPDPEPIPRDDPGTEPAPQPLPRSSGRSTLGISVDRPPRDRPPSSPVPSPDPRGIPLPPVPPIPQTSGVAADPIGAPTLAQNPGQPQATAFRVGITVDPNPVRDVPDVMADPLQDQWLIPADPSRLGCSLPPLGESLIQELGQPVRLELEISDRGTVVAASTLVLSRQTSPAYSQLTQCLAAQLQFQPARTFGKNQVSHIHATIVATIAAP